MRPGPGASEAPGASIFQKHRVLPRFSRFLGHFASLLAHEKSSKTMRFTAFFALFASLRISTFSRPLFRKSCENHAFYRVFRATRLRSRVRFFVVSARSLFKKLLKTTRFHAFFASPRARHGPLVFRILFSSLFFAFCQTLQKPRVFARFLNFGREPRASL